jgi:restriction endonuclease Mrr
MQPTLQDQALTRQQIDDKLIQAGQATKLTGDDGIDGIINEHELGLDSI